MTAARVYAIVIAGTQSSERTRATWNPGDAGDTVEVIAESGDLQVGSVGAGGVGAVRATIGMPAGTGRYYWETTHTHTSEGPTQAAGMAKLAHDRDTELGFTGGDSVAAFDPSGDAFANSVAVSEDLPPLASGYVIQHHYDSDTGSYDVSVNGSSSEAVRLYALARGLTGTWYAAAWISDPGDSIAANFGQSAFAYPPAAGHRLGIYSDDVTTSPSRYYASAGFRSSASDTPANQYFEPLLASDFVIDRRLSCVAWGDASTSVQYSDLLLFNFDGSLDGLKNETGIRDREVRAYRGVLGEDFASFVPFAVCLIDRVDGDGARYVKLVLKDQRVQLQKAVSVGDAPFCFGLALSCPVRALPDEAGTFLYQVGDAEPNSIDVVRDRGVVLTPVTGWTEIANAPPWGVDLALEPSGIVLVDMDGAKFSSGASSSLFQEAFRLLCIDRGGLDSSRVYTASLTDFSDSHEYPIGAFYAKPPNIDAILDDVMLSWVGWWFFDHEGLLQVGALAEPGAPDFYLTEDEFEGEISSRFDEAAGLSDQVAGLKNWQALDDAELVPVGPSMTAQERALLMRSYRFTARGGTELAPDYSGSADSSGVPLVAETKKGRGAGIGTLHADPIAVRLVADGLTYIYRIRRNFYDFAAYLSTSLEVGQLGKVVHVTRARPTELAAGKALLVTRVRVSALSNLVDFTGWG